METRIGDSLQPCTLPPDAQYFENPNGSAHASLHLRSGVSSSQVTYPFFSFMFVVGPAMDMEFISENIL